MTDGQVQDGSVGVSLASCLPEHDGDVLRERVRVLAQALMDVEVTELVGAERHERTDERTGYRNGSRTRNWDTRVGTIELSVPKVRSGSYYPSLLQSRRRAEQALRAVVQEAYVHGVSTRKVDELVKALGLDGTTAAKFAASAVPRLMVGPPVRRCRLRPALSKSY